MNVVDASQPAFRLVILGDGSIRTIPLHGTRWVVGRSSDCEIPLRDLTVSRRHVRLERKGDEFTFQDLGGRNPVLIDGKPSTGGALKVDQTLVVGLTRLMLESRNRPAPMDRREETVFITGRQVIDHGMPEPEGDSEAARARRILEQIEWTFADLGALTDAAEPLLVLALDLTGHQRGLIGQFLPTHGLDVLATRDTSDRVSALSLPEPVLREAQQLKQVSLLTTSAGDTSIGRLVIPLGTGPEGILVLEAPTEDAPSGQELLRLAHTLGKVIWHRLVEARERLRLREEVRRLRFQGSATYNAVLTSKRLRTARYTLRELSDTDDAILIIGEEGTEREPLARYLHAEGSGEGPFVTVHVGMTPESRIERLLFGDGEHDIGALRRANGGSLLVDGVTLLPHHIQQRLAHACSPARKKAVNGSATRPARLIAAADEGPHVAPKSWHPELARLLTTHSVTIPPLREEADDVVALAELFLAGMGAAPDGSPRLLSERARRLLRAYSWPGNVRQLRDVMESAAAMAGSNQIAPRHLPADIAEPRETSPANELPSLEEVERRHIRTTLDLLGGNRMRAAQALGIATSTLYDKLRRFGVDN